MPFNGSGTFTIPNTFVPNTTILSAAVNANFTDIATGLSDCLTRDGQAGMSAAFKAIAGSIGAPGISFTADATAGLYLNTTGIVGLVAKSLGILLNSSIYQVSAAAVQSGGSNYAVGDTITETGGTAINQAVLTVATLSGTAVATVTVTYPGNYTVKPADPVAQGSSSGIGTGASFNMTWTTQFTRSVVTDEANNPVWQRLGASSFVSGLMPKANGLDFATAIGAANLAQVIGGTFLLEPQGILSPISSTTNPIPTIDSTAITRLYWTPYKGNVGPIYNGTSFVMTTSAQIFCDLTAGAQVSGGIYDVYKFLNAGTVTLGFSPSWLAGTSGNVTAGSCARGTGTGGTALAVLNGLFVNTVSMTVNNGATTFTIPVNQGTYLGSIYINSTAGQINCHKTYGQSRIWGLWNNYNRQIIQLLTGDSTASWTPGGSLGAINANANNVATEFCGLQEEQIISQYSQFASVSFSSNTCSYQNGIGLNSTVGISGFAGTIAVGNNTTAGTGTGNAIATFSQTPILGINKLQMLEARVNTASASGTVTDCLMTTTWRG